MKKYLLLVTVSLLIFSTKSFAISEINKNLFFSAGKLRILTFDEKIINYKFDNEKNFKAEILTNIFGYKQELLIKSLKPVKNKLTVWTKSRTYNFDINFEQDISTALDSKQFELDEPPAFPEKAYGMADFELDSPPVIK